MNIYSPRLTHEYMSGNHEPAEQEATEHKDTKLDPEILEMIADNLDDRATVLQDEAERATDSSEQLRKIAEKLRD